MWPTSLNLQPIYKKIPNLARIGFHFSLFLEGGCFSLLISPWKPNAFRSTNKLKMLAWRKPNIRPSLLNPLNWWNLETFLITNLYFTYIKRNIFTWKTDKNGGPCNDYLDTCPWFKGGKCRVCDLCLCTHMCIREETYSRWLGWLIKQISNNCMENWTSTITLEWEEADGHPVTVRDQISTKNK